MAERDGDVSWSQTHLTRRLGIRLPIVQAPMAGGWTPPRLVATVSEAGGLGSLAGAMLGPDALRDQIRQIRSLTGQPFAVNLFAPLPEPREVGLPDWAALHGVPAPTPTARTFGFADQLSVVSNERVPVLSFTFGVPSTAGFTGFVIGTATTVGEAVALAAAGVDAVVAQGYEAGGHRGTFQAPLNADELAASLIGTMSLVPQMVDAVSIPVIASGGIMDGRGIAAARALGAQGVQLGTAFLATDEAGIDPGFRQALGEPTSVTAVLTGRPARAVRSAEVRRLEASGIRPPDYPLPRLFLTEPPRLAGQGAPMARAIPAAQLVELLERETMAAFEGMN